MAALTVVHDLQPLRSGLAPRRPARPSSPAARTHAPGHAPVASPSVSVCIPAHNEEASIGHLVGDMHRMLVETGTFKEIIVIDDRSEDFTSLVARAAGARVVAGHDILTAYGPGFGKGDAMWRSLAVSSGDIVVWCDADLRRFDVCRLAQLVQPLIDDERVRMAKGYFTRLTSDGRVGPGGRVTELVARPLLSLLFPDAGHIREPLGGIFAMRRDAAEDLSFEPDYGVDVGLLIDTIQCWGRSAIAQVDLGNLSHRNQTVEGLAVQAAAVQRAILSRAVPQLSRLGSRPRLPDRVAPLRPPLSSLSLRDLRSMAAGPLHAVSQT